jgi:hypothetical protein
MERYTRTVVGYHGCDQQFALKLLTGELSISDWTPSNNQYDWLGEGIYFWEYAEARAWRWAVDKAREKGDPWKPAVIGAVIQLGRCLDFTDESDTRLLGEAYAQVSRALAAAGQPMPENKGRDDDLKARHRDCLVINWCIAKTAPHRYQTVRGAFWEGREAFEGARIRQESHIQVAVRDPTCILGVFKPNLISR